MNRVAQQIGIELELAAFLKDIPIVAGRFMDACKVAPLSINGHLIHRDASMVELAMAPAGCPRGLAHNFLNAMNETTKLLPDDVVLKAIPAVTYTASELKRDPYASVMGCSESSNIYNLPPTSSKYTDGTRYSGMHINIQIPDAGPADALALDVFLGLYSVVNWEQPFKDEVIKRRQNYGQAGEFRLKDFGIEYRTLPSSSFCQYRMELIWELVDKALNRSDELTQQMIDRADSIKTAIQECDAEAAAQLIEELH